MAKGLSSGHPQNLILVQKIKNMVVCSRNLIRVNLKPDDGCIFYSLISDKVLRVTLAGRPNFTMWDGVNIEPKGMISAYWPPHMENLGWPMAGPVKPQP